MGPVLFCFLEKLCMPFYLGWCSDSYQIDILDQKKVSKNGLSLFSVCIPSKPKKTNYECDEWSKVEIYIFFLVLFDFRTSSTQKLCHIEQTFSTPLTHFERSTFIEISSTRGERAYRKKTADFSNTFGSLGIYGNANQLRKRIISKGGFRVLWWKQTY
jgi:hypothetical protein